MRQVFLTFALVGILTSCASRESLNDLATARAQVHRLQEQVDAQMRSQPGAESQMLISALRDAQTRLDAAVATVKREKEESRAAVGVAIETGAQTAAPYANGFIPGLGGLLVVGAGIAKKFLDKKGVA